MSRITSSSLCVAEVKNNVYVVVETQLDTPTKCKVVCVTEDYKTALQFKTDKHEIFGPVPMYKTFECHPKPVKPFVVDPPELFPDLPKSIKKPDPDLGPFGLDPYDYA